MFTGHILCPVKSDFPSSAVDCPSGFKQGFGSEKCYQYFKEHVDYLTAVERCAVMSSHLAAPTSQQENDNIIGVMNSARKSYDSGSWIGVSDQIVEDDFQLSTGGAFYYTNWKQGTCCINAHVV